MFKRRRNHSKSVCSDNGSASLRSVPSSSSSMGSANLHNKGANNNNKKRNNSITMPNSSIPFKVSPNPSCSELDDSSPTVVLQEHFPGDVVVVLVSKDDTLTDHVPSNNNSLSGQSGSHNNNPGEAASTTVSTRSGTPNAVPVKQVRFSRIEIREYERILSNNPSCSSGAPIGIGWSYVKGFDLDLEDYEAKKFSSRKNAHQLVLTRQEREAILLDWGTTFHEIVEAIRGNVRAKARRRHTVSTLGRYDRWEEIMERAGRRLKRTILLQKTSGQRAKELSAQVHIAPLPKVTSPNLPVKEHITDCEPHEGHHHHHHHSHSHHPIHTTTTTVPDVTQPASMDGSTPQKSDYGALTGMGNSSSRGDGIINEHLMKESLERREPSFTLERTASFGTQQQRHPAPISEVDIFDEVPDVSSHISYDDDITFASSTASDEYSEDDGFGQLVRDTRHWYVGGYDSPLLRRRPTPTIISEDYSSIYPTTLDQELLYVDYEGHLIEREQFYLAQFQLLQQQQMLLLQQQQQVIFMENNNTWQPYQPYPVATPFYSPVMAMRFEG